MSHDKFLAVSLYAFAACAALGLLAALVLAARERQAAAALLAVLAAVFAEYVLIASAVRLW